MNYMFNCLWCGKYEFSLYNKETCCLSCDGKLIDRTHDIYHIIEAQELLLNNDPIYIYRIIDSCNSYVESVKRLKTHCDMQINNF